MVISYLLLGFGAAISAPLPTFKIPFFWLASHCKQKVWTSSEWGFYGNSHVTLLRISSIAGIIRTREKNKSTEYLGQSEAWLLSHRDYFYIHWPH